MLIFINELLWLLFKMIDLKFCDIVYVFFFIIIFWILLFIEDVYI